MPVPVYSCEVLECGAHVGVIVFDGNDDTNALLSDSVALIRARGLRVGGLLQRFGERLPSGKRSMSMDDLGTGQALRPEQARGPGSSGCTLNPDALARAACLLGDAADGSFDVIVVPGFG